MVEVKIEDLRRLIAEVTQQSEEEFIAWMKDEGIDPEMLFELTDNMTKAIALAIKIDFTPEDAIQSALGTAFTLGWEARKQYGQT